MGLVTRRGGSRGRGSSIRLDARPTRRVGAEDSFAAIQPTGKHWKGLDQRGKNRREPQIAQALKAESSKDR